MCRTIGRTAQTPLVSTANLFVPRSSVASLVCESGSVRLKCGGYHHKARTIQVFCELNIH